MLYHLKQKHRFLSNGAIFLIWRLNKCLLYQWPEECAFRFLTSCLFKEVTNKKQKLQMLVFSIFLEN